MVADGVPPAGRSHRRGKRPGRRARGPQLVERDGYWHAYGSIRIGRQSVRLRRSLGLAVGACSQDEAEQALDDYVAEIKAHASGQVRYGDHVAEAAHAYLKLPRARPLTATTITIIKEITARFGSRRLNLIEPREWSIWIDGSHDRDGRMSGRSASTRERFLNSVLAFLNFAQAHHGLAVVPKFPRDKAARNPNRRARRQVEELRPELVWLLLANANIALRAQLAVERCTGARVSSILHGCTRGDLDLTPGRERIIFRRTKNGLDVPAALDASAVAILKQYLEWRGPFVRPTDPLFVTHRGQPYSGRQNKSAFDGAKRRAIEGVRLSWAARARECRRRGDQAGAKAALNQARIDIELLGRVTQHWFRHMLATRLVREDPRAAMEQGGWLDIRSVMAYAHDVPEHRQRLVASLDDLGTFIDTPTRRTAKPPGSSNA